MALATASAPAQTSMSLGAFARTVGASFKDSAVQAVIVGLIGAAVGWIGNVWYMAVKYDGFRVPPGAPATGEGSGLAGPAFWAMAGVVVFGLIGYRRAVGGKQFWRDIRSFPAVIGSLFSRDGRPALVHLLWGFAIAVLIAVLLSPAVSGILGLGVLILLPSLLGGIFADMIARAVRAIMRRFAPGRDTPETQSVSAAVGMTGAVIALLIAFLMSSRIVKVILAFVAGMAALILGQQMKGKTTPRLALLVVASPVALALLTVGPPALADDGGWRECGSSFSEWWDCGGSGKVKRLAVNGAVSSGFGAALGFIIGTACGALGGSLASVLQVRSADRLVDARGRPLVVNDGSFHGGRVGHVWFEGRWIGRDAAFSAVEQQRLVLAGEQVRLDTQWSEIQAEADGWFDQRITESEAMAGTVVAGAVMRGGIGSGARVGASSTGSAALIAGSVPPEAWADRNVFAPDGTVDVAALDAIRVGVHEQLATTERPAAGAHGRAATGGATAGGAPGRAAVGGATAGAGAGPGAAAPTPGAVSSGGHVGGEPGALDRGHGRVTSAGLAAMPVELGDGTVDGLRLGLTDPGTGALPVRIEGFAAVGDVASASVTDVGTAAQSIGGTVTGWGDAFRDALAGMLSGRDVLEVVQEAGGVEEQVDPFEMLGPEPDQGDAR